MRSAKRLRRVLPQLSFEMRAPMRLVLKLILLPTLVWLGFLVSCTHRTSPGAIPSWAPRSAARYLDQREDAWAGWIGSAQDRDTFCVACHTSLPYAISRSSLRLALQERRRSEGEQVLLSNVARRVQLWNKVRPYYTDRDYGPRKAAESRGTEAVLNALILASADAETGRLSDVTGTAFSYLWDSQLTEGNNRGAWAWLDFGNEPWEASDSQYYGAALAAIAVGVAPEGYRSRSEIQHNLEMLRDYFNRQYPGQPTANRVVLLWASTKLPHLIEPERRKSIIDQLRRGQQSDGGWELSRLVCPTGWSFHAIRCVQFRPDWTRQDTESDGYATGLITFTLEAAGLSTQDPTVARGIAWLARNQKADGSWSSLSLNAERRPSSNVGHFMRDAATAFAVLALTESDTLSEPNPESSNIEEDERIEGFPNLPTHDRNSCAVGLSIKVKPARLPSSPLVTSSF